MLQKPGIPIEEEGSREGRIPPGEAGIGQATGLPGTGQATGRAGIG